LQNSINIIYEKFSKGNILTKEKTAAGNCGFFKRGGFGFRGDLGGLNLFSGWLI